MTANQIDDILIKSKRDISSAWDEAIDIIRELQDKVDTLEAEIEDLKT